MSYRPSQPHELLKGLHGHRGLILTNWYRRKRFINKNYLTRGTANKRIKGYTTLCRVHPKTTGRTFSWSGNSLINRAVLNHINGQSNNITVLLPNDTAKSALTDCNIVSTFDLSTILGALNPRRTVTPGILPKYLLNTKLSHLQRGIQRVIPFEHMCLEQAYATRDTISYMDKYTTKYKSPKFHKVSNIVKEIYSILRGLTRASGLDKVAVRDLHMLAVHYERIALNTGHTHQLESLIAARSCIAYETLGTEDDDSCEYFHTGSRKPQYNTKEIADTHRRIFNNSKHHGKPFNFHSCITKSLEKFAESCIVPNEYPDIYIRKVDIASSLDGGYTTCIHHVIDPNVRSIRMFTDEQTNPSHSLPSALLGKGIEVTSSIDPSIRLSLPGIPIPKGNINKHLPYSGIYLFLNRIYQSPGLTGLEYLWYLFQRDYNIKHSIPGLDTIVNAVTLIEILKLCTHEDQLADLILAHNPGIQRSLPYDINRENSSLDLSSADEDIRLQGVLGGSCVSDNMLENNFSPDLDLLKQHILLRLLRRLTAFVLVSIKKNKDQYANRAELRGAVWEVLQEILQTTATECLQDFNSVFSRNFSIILMHAKYSLHTVLPTYLEDLVVKHATLTSHVLLMYHLIRLDAQVLGTPIHTITETGAWAMSLNDHILGKKQVSMLNIDTVLDLTNNRTLYDYYNKEV